MKLVTMHPTTARQNHRDFLYSDHELRVCGLEGDGGGVLWLAELSSPIPFDRFVDRLGELGMTCVRASRGLWELNIEPLPGAGSPVQLLVVARTQQIVIRVDASVQPADRRGTALRISKMLSLITRTFARRRWIVSQRRGDHALSRAS